LGGSVVWPFFIRGSQMHTGYTRAQIGIHWLVAVLIVANYFLGEGMEKQLDAKLEGQTYFTPWHVWIGLAVLALVVLRLVLRFAMGAPETGGVPGSLTQKLGALAHLLLYVLMIGVPLGGAIVWFQGIDALGQPHALAGNILMALAGLHALAGLYHQYVVKDGLLLRMMRPR
jgi:cytochrome b561